MFVRYRIQSFAASNVSKLIIFAGICAGLYGFLGGSGITTWMNDVPVDDRGIVMGYSFAACIFLLATGFLFKDAFMPVHADEG